MFFSSIRMFMVVVDGDGEDWASEESMFILVPTKELFRSDQDDPEWEIFLQKPLILQKLSRQQKHVERISKRVSSQRSKELVVLGISCLSNFLVIILDESWTAPPYKILIFS
jgi:hypothetical protein